MIAYKCVSAKDGKYLSAMSSSLPEEFVLEYKINETTTSKIGRIYVFKTHEAAITFLYSNKAVRCVLKGIATNIGIPKQLAELKEVEEFWKCKYAKKRILYNILKDVIPKNTLTCSSFTPIEKL